MVNTLHAKRIASSSKVQFISDTSVLPQALLLDSKHLKTWFNVESPPSLNHATNNTEHRLVGAGGAKRTKLLPHSSTK